MHYLSATLQNISANFMALIANLESYESSPIFHLGYHV